LDYGVGFSRSPPPLEVVWVNPDNINYISKNTPKNAHGVLTDQELNTGNRIDETAVYKALEQRFVDELPWDETNYPEVFEWWRKGPESDFDERCNVLDSLYQSLSEEGYKSQRELLRDNPENVWKSNNDGLHPLINEITVNIDANGELLWRSRGKHRLSLAKILNLDSVPVLVNVRHRDAPPINHS